MLTALLAVVARGSEIRRGGGQSGGTSAVPVLLGDRLVTLALVLFGIAAVASVWLMLQSRHIGVPEDKADWHWTVVAAAVLALLMLGGLYAAKWNGGHLQTERKRPAAALAPTHIDHASAPRSDPLGQPSTPKHRLRLPWLPGAVIGAVLLSVALSIQTTARRRRKKPAVDERVHLAEAIEEALGDDLNDLRLERDPRRAVIRAYARMEEAFAAYGVPREPADAPFEFLARALKNIRVSVSSVRRLAELFERARFSQHAIDGRMKGEAIDALAGLQSELRQRLAAR